MSKITIVGTMTLAALGAYAACIGLKPGLWEVKTLNQAMDAGEKSGQMAAANDKMAAALANMPAGQRAQVEAMMKSRGIGAGGPGGGHGFKICVTPEMAKRDKPIVDRDGHCQPGSVNHSGNQTTYEFSCVIDGATTKGKGTSTVDGEVITQHVELTRTDAQGKTQTMNRDSEMRFVGADCGDVKPIEMPK